jgi:hypothetical protein
MKIGDKVRVCKPRLGREDLNGLTGTIVKVRKFAEELPIEYGCMENGLPFSITTVHYTVELDEAMFDKKVMDRDGLPLEYIELTFEESEIKIMP